MVVFSYRAVSLLMLVWLLGAASAAPAAAESRVSAAEPRTWEREITMLRTLYHSAIADEKAIDRGLAAIQTIRSVHGIDGAKGERGALLTAYSGALITLRAKHAFWPPDRLRHLREGLALLDAAVGTHPQVAEIRYLRLMSCYYLPGILGRNGSVREDFAALARLLPEVRQEYPADLYNAIAEFVVREGKLPLEDRERIASTLRDD